MGRRRELVRPGAPLGFVPSAALLVRRDALADGAFEPALRLGEDVDLVWRLAAAGRHVRYEPAVTVLHDARLRFAAWARRRYEYGTSAADLDRRHPGRLAPARPSAWNLAALGLLVAGRPLGAAAVGGPRPPSSAGAWSLPAVATRRSPVVVVGKGVVADAAALGHALRREWWPLGWAALALAAVTVPAARAARGGHARAVALEWVRERPDVDPARYALLPPGRGRGLRQRGDRQRRPRPPAGGVAAGHPGPGPAPLTPRTALSVAS